MNTFAEIREAVLRGETVCWKTTGYAVVHDTVGQWLVVCRRNDHCVGLYEPDYNPKDFFVRKAQP